VGVGVVALTLGVAAAKAKPKIADAATILVAAKDFETFDDIA